MTTSIVPCSYLPIFFNPLLRSGNTVTFSVTAPMLDGYELCKISIKSEGPEIHAIARNNEYDKIFKHLKSKAGKRYLSDEVPEYSHFQDAFFLSGVLKPDGLDRLYGYISEASLQSVIRGGDVYYIAFDTNILRDRIYSNHLRRFSDAPNVDFILSETVRSELTNRRGKIRKKMVSELFDIIGVTAYNLLNQNVLADRLRYIGFLEYNRVRHETDCDQLKTVRANSKDEEIIHAYASFAGEGHNRKILLVSRDNEFIRMSPSLPDVIPIIIEARFPRKTSMPIQCTYDNLFCFIYYLAVIYAQVDISLMGHVLYECSGVWTQKNVRHWENDYIRISANKGLPFIKELEKHIAVLQNMKYKKESWRFPRVSE
ncbi:MAG: hypothetical protein GXP46_05895 [Deferribacteres bacterium]|nr:hypothetical protein [Deferribacteres bacterium]